MFIICKSDGDICLIDEIVKNILIQGGIQSGVALGKHFYKSILNPKNKGHSIHFHDLVKNLADESETYRVLVKSGSKDVIKNQDAIGLSRALSQSDELSNTCKNKFNREKFVILTKAYANLKFDSRHNKISDLEYSRKRQILKNLAPLFYLYGEVTKLSSGKFIYSSERLDDIIFSGTDNNIDRILRNRFNKSLIVYADLDSSITTNALGYLIEYITNSQSTDLSKLASELLSNSHENQAEDNTKIGIVLKGMEFLNPQKKDADLIAIEQYINHEEPNRGPKLIQSFVKCREFMCINLYLTSLIILAYKEKSFPPDEFIDKIHLLDDEYGQQLNFQNI